MNLILNCLLCLLFLLPSVKAQDSTSVLSHYIQRALEANTDIRASHLAVQASQQENRITSALPDPALMLEGRGIPLDLRVGETRELMFMLEQMFPPPGALKRMQRRGEFTADIEEQMQRAVQLDIVRQVKQTFYQLAYLDAALTANSEHSRLLNEFEDIAESKYVVGKTSQQDLYQIKIEQARLESERVSLQEKRATLAAEFNRLLNRKLDEIVHTDAIVGEPIAYDSTGASESLERHNPFLAAARIRIESGDNDIQLARANTRPSFKVMGGYMAMNTMDDALMGRVGMTLPFMPWSNKDTRAALEKSRVLKNKADVDYQTLKDQFAVRLIEKQKAMATLDHQLKLYETQIIPASEQNLALSLIRYQADETDFLSLIQVAREKLSFELQRDKLSSEYWQNVAHLEYIVGKDVEVIK